METPCSPLPGAPPDFALGDAILPERYELLLEPAPSTRTLRGEVTVRWRCGDTAQPCVTLNALGITVTGAWLTVGPQQETAEATWEEDAPSEKLHFALRDSTPIPPGPGVLRACYTARIRESAGGQGMYLAKVQCEGSEGDEKMLCTYLEPTNARCVVPCFDEPAVKVPWQMRVDRAQLPAEWAVLSNTAAERTEGTVITFKPTPPMCSYLLCLIAGCMHCIEGDGPDGMRLRVWLPAREPLESARTGMRLLQLAVGFYTRLFAKPLPLEKLDLVGVADIAALAMENLGCLVFRLDYLAITPATSYNQVQRIVRLVGHEVSHHWFGNLCSIQRWDYLWLKEGVARFLEFVFACSVFPAWDYWSFFVGSVLQEALDADEDLRVAHPVERRTVDPRKVMDTFDAISYGKGAAVIHQLSRLLGWEAFVARMRSFLRRFSVASSADFWAEMGAAEVEEVAPQPASAESVQFHALMASSGSWQLPPSAATAACADWITAPGHPTLYCAFEEGGDRVRLQQFCTEFDGLAGSQVCTVRPATYQCPVQVLSEGSVVTASAVLPSAEAARGETLQLPVSAAPCAVNGSRLFRTWYSPAALARVLRSYSALPGTARVALVRDSSSLRLHSGLARGATVQSASSDDWWLPRADADHPQASAAVLLVLRQCGAARECHRVVLWAAAKEARLLQHLCQGEPYAPDLGLLCRRAFSHVVPLIAQTATGTLPAGEAPAGGAFAAELGELARYSHAPEAYLDPNGAAEVLGSLAEAGDPACVQLAEDLVGRFLREWDDCRCPVVLVGAAVHATVRLGGEAEWWRALELLRLCCGGSPSGSAAAPRPQLRLRGTHAALAARSRLPRSTAEELARDCALALCATRDRELLEAAVVALLAERWLQDRHAVLWSASLGIVRSSAGCAVCVPHIVRVCEHGERALEDSGEAAGALGLSLPAGATEAGERYLLMRLHEGRTRGRRLLYWMTSHAETCGEDSWPFLDYISQYTLASENMEQARRRLTLNRAWRAAVRDDWRALLPTLSAD